jgi:dethiobiotin synthetase
VTDVVIVTAPATEVGKTWVGARLLEELRARGIDARAYKPAQSFGDDDGPTDAEVLARASGQDPLDVCPEERWYAKPLAPPMAAALLGRPPILIADLVAETTAAMGTAELVLVEGAGGARSPLAEDGDVTDLARGLGARLAIVVADPSLGMINAVRSSLDALGDLPTLFFANRFDEEVEVQRLNRAWLVDRLGLRVTHEIGELAEWVLEGHQPTEDR